jgi:hypothetical protein
MLEGWRRKGRAAEKNFVIQRSLERFGRKRQVVESRLNRFLRPHEASAVAFARKNDRN